MKLDSDGFGTVSGGSVNVRLKQIKVCIKELNGVDYKQLMKHSCQLLSCNFNYQLLHTHLTIYPTVDFSQIVEKIFQVKA